MEDVNCSQDVLQVAGPFADPTHVAKINATLGSKTRGAGIHVHTCHGSNNHISQWLNDGDTRRSACKGGGEKKNLDCDEQLDGGKQCSRPD